MIVKRHRMRPDRMSSDAMQYDYKIETPSLTKPLKPPKPMTFEQAMAFLRKGKSIRRRSWHAESRIFRLGSDVFLKLPGNVLDGRERPADGSAYGSPPTFWKPYPGDFLATDWEVVNS